MKKWIWLGLAGVIVIWALSAAVTLPAVQSKLQAAAAAELARPEYTGAFDEVKASFSGQEATLTGRVASQAEHDQLTTVIGSRMRTAGSSLAPVTAVYNSVGVAYELQRQRPKPWLLLARHNGQGVIAGVLPPELKDKAVKALTDKLAGAKVTPQINTKLASDSKPRPALDANATLDAKAVPQVADDQVAVTAVDGQWVLLKVTSKDTEISDALFTANVDSGEVVEAMAPIRAQQAAEEEKAQNAKLPPAYAGIVALPEALHIFGQAGDDESQRRLVSSLTAAYPKRKVLTSAVRVSNETRKDSDWASALAALPKGDNDAFIAAFTAGGKPVVWNGKDDEPAMQKALATTLPSTFNYAALWMPYVTWLKSTEPPAPKLNIPSPPALNLPKPTVPPAPGSPPVVQPAPRTLPPPSNGPPASTITVPPPVPVPPPAPPAGSSSPVTPPPAPPPATPAPASPAPSPAAPPAK